MTECMKLRVGKWDKGKESGRRIGKIIKTKNVHKKK